MPPQSRTVKMLNQVQYDKFWRHGFVIAKSLFDDQEIQLLTQAIEQCKDVQEKAMQLEDSEGGVVSLALWNEPGSDLFGAVTRCHRVVNSMEFLLGGEVYHYHSKVTAKKPHSSGAWDWHQDYGYWYDNGVLYPNLASVMIAIDETHKDNGCLQVIDGSHKMGRINHGMVADQAGADFDRVNEILKTHKRVYVELQPGDAVFFHCNTLHRSDKNQSDSPRTTFISSYNRADNSSYREHQHPNYNLLVKMPDEALKVIGLKDFGKDREFFPQPPKREPATDKA